MKNRVYNLITNHWIPLTYFIITFLWFTVFAFIGIDPHHDGILLKPAIDIINGKMLFKDTFTQYGMLTTLIQAAAIKVIGPYLISIKISTVLFYSLSVILLYYIWRNFLTDNYFFIVYFLFLITAPFYPRPMLPWSSVYALFFLLLTNLFVINFIKKDNVIWLFWAGIASALAFWCRQPIGVVIYLSIVCFLIIYFLLSPKKWKKILFLFYYIINWFYFLYFIISRVFIL